MSYISDRSAIADFVSYAKCLMLADGHLNQIMATDHKKHLTERADVILKAAVAAGTTTSPEWAGNLVSYQAIASAFVESLRSISVFDAMLPNMRRVPLKTILAVVTSSIEGSGPSEGQAKPVSRLSVGGATLDASKAIALIVVSDELLRGTDIAAQELLATEMRKGVSAATNRKFLAGVTSGAAAFVSSGSTPAAIYADIAKLGKAVSVTGTSKLYLVVDPASAVSLSFKTTADGLLAFPDMTPSGGAIGGVPTLVSDELPQDSSGSSVALLDADSIAAGDMTVTLRGSKHATLQMNTTPGEGAQQQVSMFQTGSYALIAERWYGFERLRSTGAALLTGVEW